MAAPTKDEFFGSITSALKSLLSIYRSYTATDDSHDVHIELINTLQQLSSAYVNIESNKSKDLQMFPLLSLFDEILKNISKHHVPQEEIVKRSTNDASSTCTSEIVINTNMRPLVTNKSKIETESAKRTRQSIINEEEKVVNVILECLTNVTSCADYGQCILKYADLLQNIISMLLDDKTWNNHRHSAADFLLKTVSHSWSGDAVMPIWSRISHSIKELFDTQDKCLVDYSGKITLACLSSLHLTDKDIGGWLETISGNSCVKFCIQQIRNGADDWSFNILKIVLKCSKFVLVMSDMNLEERYMILEVVQHTMRNHDDHTTNHEVHTLHQNVIEYICHDFGRLSEVVQTSSLEESSLSLLVLSNELELLCHASSEDYFSTSLRNNRQLLRTAIALLRHIHDLSKTSGNLFTSQHKMSDLNKADTLMSCDLSGPEVGMKRDLVRLVGNLCHRNKDNQDLIRELDGIELVLDQTRMDAKNPYITQWSVLAIRNLCENNHENCAVISNLKLQGVANQVHMLEDMGVRAELVGDRIVVKDMKYI